MLTIDDLSRDLAYISQRGGGVGGGSVIVVRSLETGKEREFLPEFSPRDSYSKALRWSPDGRFILFRGVPAGGLHYRRGLFRLEVETGAVTTVVPPAREPYIGGWALDAEDIYYTVLRPATNSTHILKRDLETGEETELASGVKPNFLSDTLALSPDGRSLAYTHPWPESNPVKWPESNAVKVVSTAGGEPRELFRVEKPEIIHRPLLTWTPDGRYLIFAKGREGRKEIGLWRIPSEGGEPEKLGMKIDQSNAELRFHPDGRQVAFTAKKEVDEIWALENFLPELRAAK